MNQKKRKRQNQREPHKLKGILSEHSRLRGLSLALILLSLADLLMTYLLLQSGSHFYERNPIANFFFHRWNILGMTLFKFTMVGIIITISEVVERYHPGRGGLILIVGCCAVGFVFAYGARLYLHSA
jgi:hypothetical protein